MFFEDIIKEERMKELEFPGDYWKYYGHSLKICKEHSDIM